MRNVLHLCAATVLALILVACTDRSERSPLPTSPSPASPAPPPGPSPSGPNKPVTIQVVSGVDLHPVTGARVSIAGYQGLTDATGRFTAETTPEGPATPIDIDADGFLHRQTSLKSGVLVSLWPAANDLEADAIRTMVYGRLAPFGEVRTPYDKSSMFYVTLRRSPAAQIAWEAEAVRIGEAIGVIFQVGGTFQYEVNEILVDFSSGQCQNIPAAWGFCVESSPYRTFRVRPELQSDPATLRRVLASMFIGSNPLPGLMNSDSPANALSPLELQTIRMILQRNLPTRWPDNDR